VTASEDDGARIVDEQGSVAHGVSRWQLSVDARGLMNLTVELRGAPPLTAAGRLTGTCERIDQSSSLHVVDLASDPRCARIVGWL
jgi:hypothetical protein